MTDKECVLDALEQRGTLAEAQQRTGLPVERVRNAIIELEHEKKLDHWAALNAWEQTWRKRG